MYRARITLVALATLALSLPAMADTIVMANGDRASGTIVGVAGGRVVFDTTHFGTMDVALADVAQLTTDAPVVINAGDQRLVGRLQSDADSETGLRVVGDDGAYAGLSMAQVSSIALANDTSAADGDGTWASTADLAVNVATGNSETQTIAVRTNTLYANGPYEHQLAIAYDRAENENPDTEESEVTQDQLDVGYDFRWFFRDAWYASANLGYFSDRIKDIDQRITAGAGLGHRFWDNSLGALSAEVGVSQVFESLDGESESNPALRWALQYNRWIQPERYELFHNHELLKILDSARGEVINASTGLRMHFNESLNASIRADVIHETKPLPGREKTDVVYALGVGVSF